MATQVAMGRAADELGLPEVATLILELARVANPRAPLVNRPLAQLYERQGNFRRAVPLWQLVAEEAPADPEASRKVKDLAANQTLSAGDYASKALDEDGLVALRRDSMPTPQEQEEQAERQRHREPAKLKERIATEPHKPEAYLRLAELHRSAGAFEAARETLEQGLQATHRHFEIQMALVDLEIDPCRWNLRKVRERLAQQPADPDLRQQEAQWEKEVLARELAYYRQRADHQPSDGGARLQLAIRLRKLGKPKEAILELEPLKNHQRWGWRALAELAECYVLRRNSLLARNYWEQALSALPPEAEEERQLLQQRMTEGLAQLEIVTTPMPAR
jgi:tetratricopeptide (TPR) repeat protein